MQAVATQLNEAPEEREIAATTKIAASALEALERNDSSKMPGGIFSRAFVRSYAIEIGLDPDRTVQLIKRHMDDPGYVVEMDGRAWTVTAGSTAPVAAGKIH